MSEVLDPPVSHPVTDALEVLLSAMDDLSELARSGPEGELWTMSGPQMLETAAAVHQAMCRADAVLHSVVRDVDARGAAVQAGAVSTAGWLRGRLRLHPGVAKRLVATPRALHDDPTAPWCVMSTPRRPTARLRVAWPGSARRSPRVRSAPST